MKKMLLIVLCKILHFFGNLIGRGSSLPGQIILKLDRDILSKLTYPKTMIAVTGSNGKTSTTEIIYTILKENGYNVISNLKGSNQIEGITTMLLNNCDLKGNIKAEIIVLESDERYLQHTFHDIKPTHILVTNIYRDQLSRNAHPEFIFDEIKKVITPDIHLILNTDDPLSSLYGFERDNVTYFGMRKNDLSKQENTSVYDDGKYCPNCKDKLNYDYYHYNQIGSYHCDKCGFKRVEPNFEITSLDLEKGQITINDKYSINLSMKNIYTAYNLLSAFATASVIGVQEDDIVRVESDYVMKNDRIQEFKLEDKEIVLLTSKHENSISYNQSLRFVANQKEDITVVILVDQISRKYYTSETSWIWDIDFERLQAPCIKQIILAGRYANDLAIRFEYSDIEKEHIDIILDLDEMIQKMRECTTQKIYFITCFSDRDKLKKRL